MEEKFENGVALIIGTASDPQIAATAKDAQVIFDLLAPIYADIKLVKEKEATRKGILDAFDWLHQMAHDESTVFIYYAGHGYEVKVDGQKSYYLFPYGGELNKPKTLLSAEEIGQRFHSTVAQKKVWFLNACHSAGFMDAMGAASLSVKSGPPMDGALEEIQKELSLSTSRFAEMLSEGKGKVVISAAQADAKSFLPLPQSVHSDRTIFGQALIEVLEGKANTDLPFIYLATAYDYIQKKVKERTAAIPNVGMQLPELKGNLSSFKVTLNPRHVPLQQKSLAVHIDVSLLNYEALQQNVAPDSIQKYYKYKIGNTEVSQDWMYDQLLEKCKEELDNGGRDAAATLKNDIKKLIGIYLFDLLDEVQKAKLLPYFNYKDLRFILDFRKVAKEKIEKIISLPWENMGVPKGHFENNVPRTYESFKKKGVMTRMVPTEFSMNHRTSVIKEEMVIVFLDNSEEQSLVQYFIEKYDYKVDEASFEIAQNVEALVLGKETQNILNIDSIQNIESQQPDMIYYYGNIEGTKSKPFLKFDFEGLDEKQIFENGEMDDFHPFQWLYDHAKNPIASYFILHAEDDHHDGFPQKMETATYRLSTYGIPNVVMLSSTYKIPLSKILEMLMPKPTFKTLVTGYAYDFEKQFQQIKKSYENKRCEFEPLFYCNTDVVTQFVIKTEANSKSIGTGPTRHHERVTRQQHPKDESSAINVRVDERNERPNVAVAPTDPAPSQNIIVGR